MAPEPPESEKHALLLFSGVIEKRDSKPLLNILDVVGGWPVAMDKWTEIMGKYRQVFRLKPHNYPQASYLLLESPKRLIPLRDKLRLHTGESVASMRGSLRLVP